MSLAVVKRFGFSLSLILLVNSGAIAQRSYDDNGNAQQAAAKANITQGPTIQYADDQFAVITWTTDQPFISRVFYGKDAGNLNQISEDVRSQSFATRSICATCSRARRITSASTPGKEPLRQLRPIA